MRKHVARFLVVLKNGCLLCGEWAVGKRKGYLPKVPGEGLCQQLWSEWALVLFTQDGRTDITSTRAVQWLAWCKSASALDMHGRDIIIQSYLCGYFHQRQPEMEVYYRLRFIKVLNLHIYAYTHAAFCHVFVAAHHSILCEWCDRGRWRGACEWMCMHGMLNNMFPLFTLPNIPI